MFTKYKFHKRPCFKCDVFGVGEIVGSGMQAGASIYGAERAKDATDSTNETNYKIAQEANELQDKWFHENQDFNAVQAQLNRDFQSQEAEKARVANQQWNSIQAQAKRAIDTGFNPASVVGGASGTTVVGASPQGSAASSGSAPNAIAAQMQNPASAIVQALAPLSQVGQTMADIALKKSQMKKNEAETEGTLTHNSWIDALNRAGLKVSEATSAKLYADAKQSEEYLKVINQDVERIKAVTNLTNSEAAIKKIEEKWKDKELQAMINKNLADAGYSQEMTNYYKELLPVQLGLYRSETALNQAEARLKDMETHLTSEQINEVRETTSLIKTNNANALIDHTIKRTYGLKNAKEEYKQNVARTDQMEYNADNTVQVLGTTANVISAVAGAATSVGAVGAAGKYIRSAKGAGSSVSTPASHVPGQNFPYN